MLGIEFRASNTLGKHSHIELRMLAKFSILKRYRQPRYGSGMLPVLDQEPMFSNCLYRGVLQELRERQVLPIVKSSDNGLQSPST